MPNATLLNGNLSHSQWDLKVVIELTSACQKVLLLSSAYLHAQLMRLPEITHPCFQLWVLEYKGTGNYVGEEVKELQTGIEQKKANKQFSLFMTFNQNNLGCYLVKKSTIFVDRVIFTLSFSHCKKLSKVVDCNTLQGFTCS